MSDTNSLAVAEMEGAKAALASEIRIALASFTARTGVLVRSVNVQSMTIARDGVVVSGPRYKVDVEVKL